MALCLIFHIFHSMLRQGVTLSNMLEFLDSIFCWPGWNAFVAIGTLALAIATFSALRHAKEERQRSLNREIAEKVYKPLIDNLEKGMAKVEEFERFQRWIWSEVKKEVVANQLSSSLWDELEHFSNNVLKYNTHHGQYHELLDNVVNEKIERHNPEYSRHFRQIYFRLWIGGEAEQITFYKLIFQDKTLSQYLSEKEEELGFSPIEKGVLIGGYPAEGWSKEDFEKILSSIKTHVIGDPGLQRFIEETRTFYEKAKAIKERLENKLKAMKFV